MKVKKLLLPLLLFFIALFAMVGCTNTKTVEYITDIAGYENMESGGDKIEVSFENGKQFGFNFTIEDKAEIDEIVNLVLTTQLINLGNNSPVEPGDNTHFTVYQGENVYGIALSGVMSNDNRYAFSTNDLREKIRDIAETKGAFDTEVGVIYKVIDLQNIESVEEEKINVADKTAILALLENSYSDCEYFYLFDSENLAEQYFTSGITENELAAYQYKDTITAGEGKLVVMWHIYQNYNAESYYLTSPSMSTTNIDKSYIEFAFGLWHNYYLNITIVS